MDAKCCKLHLEIANSMTGTGNIKTITDFFVSTHLIFDADLRGERGKERNHCTCTILPSGAVIAAAVVETRGDGGCREQQRKYIIFIHSIAILKERINNPLSPSSHISGVFSVSFYYTKSIFKVFIMCARLSVALAKLTCKRSIGPLSDSKHVFAHKHSMRACIVTN